MNDQIHGKIEGAGILHRFARILIVLCMLAPLGASPLGLGDIVLHSALNQPLNADIELTALGKTRGEDITVKLAPAAVFESAGLDRSRVLTTFDFQVETTANGAPYIKVTSADPIKEPFLDFLVEVDWPSGHLLREYTLLLDPPVLIDEEPMPITAPVAGESAAAVERTGPGSGESARDAARSGEPGSVASGASLGALNYGPVQRADTLWSIANRMKAAGASASVEQIMMALLKSNPEAFDSNNINELKAGYVLRITDPALLAAMSRAAAAAEVKRQNEQWMDSKRALAGTAGAAPQGMPDASWGGADEGTAVSAGDGPRLRLSVPETTPSGMAPEGVAGEAGSGESQGADIVRLKNELTAALESSEATRQENTELRERLAVLQEQIDAMQRLTTLQDDTLAALQAGAGTSSITGDQAAATADEGGNQPKADSAEKAAASVAAARKPSSPASEELLGGLLNDPKILAIAGGAGVLLLSLIWLVLRRRRSANLMDEISSGAGAREQSDSPAPAWASAALAQPELVAEQNAAAAARMPEPEAEAEESSLDTMRADEDEIDVLAEADVYLAYRRFDKAEELLREAVRIEPGRQDLIVKLLEVQAASGNKDAFIAQAASLKQSTGPVDAAAWDKVLAMGKRIAPEHPLFAGGAAGAVAAASMAADEGQGGDLQPDLGEDLSDLVLDADIAAELDKLGEFIPDSGAASASVEAESGGVGLELGEGAAESLPDMDLSLDEHALSDLGGISLDGASSENSPGPADVPFPAMAANTNVIDFETRTGLGQSGAGEKPSEENGLAGDIDWLADITEGISSLEEADLDAEDDFSSLISGEDEVGTKLDLAKAYIDMGDQESARNILNEVVQEGTQDQQREASDLMRHIG